MTDDQNVNAAITDITDARYLKREGLPLNTPITHCEFSKEWNRHWVRLQKAHDELCGAMGAMLAFIEASKHGVSFPKWKAFKRRFKALKKEAERCDAFVGKLCGIKSLSDKPTPTYKTEEDEREAALMMFFLSQRVVPTLEYFESMIDAAEAGNTVRIRPEDIPLWFDPE
jgi:hypothetical protein